MHQLKTTNVFGVVAGIIEGRREGKWMSCRYQWNLYKCGLTVLVGRYGIKYVGKAVAHVHLSIAYDRAPNLTLHSGRGIYHRYLIRDRAWYIPTGSSNIWLIYHLRDLPVWGWLGKLACPYKYRSLNLALMTFLACANRLVRRAWLVLKYSQLFHCIPFNSYRANINTSVSTTTSTHYAPHTQRVSTLQYRHPKLMCRYTPCYATFENAVLRTSWSYN
jgi:hypothetical protein